MPHWHVEIHLHDGGVIFDTPVARSGPAAYHAVLTTRHIDDTAVTTASVVACGLPPRKEPE